MCKREKIVYIPHQSIYSTSNRYSINMIHILEQKYYVRFKIAKPTAVFDILDTKAVILNWVETELDKHMKQNILWHRLLGVKIVWVFHNKYPHDTQKDERISDNIEWLADNSTTIILHSRHSRQYVPNIEKNQSKLAYVPHIEYKDQSAWIDAQKVSRRYDISEDVFVFSMFGFLSPYKKCEHAIEAFQKLPLDNAKLIIAGMPCDNVYAEKLLKMCEGDKNIILDFRYLSDIELNELLVITDVVVIPYVNESSMNSGVMIQAFSCGKTVIVSDFAMARDYALQSFFYGYSKSLEKVMKKAYRNGKEKNKRMGEEAKKYMDTHNNEDIVRDRLYDVLR